MNKQNKKETANRSQKSYLKQGTIVINAQSIAFGKGSFKAPVKVDKESAAKSLIDLRQSFKALQ